MEAPVITRLRPDSTWWRRRDGDSDVVVAGSPLRFFRIGTRGHEAIDAVEGGVWPKGADQLIARLIEAGAVHPLPSPIWASPEASDETTSESSVDALTEACSNVTVVIPARDEDPAMLERLVRAFEDCDSVVIVDDGSRNPLPDLPGSRTIRCATSRGPAAARNTGLAAVNTRLVLFCDADLSLDRETARRTLSTLLAHLTDPRVSAVAPRVTSTPGRSTLARYETTSSPLDMGDEPALVRMGSRVSYVPSACVLVDTERLRAVGGFDEGLRFGEDVDLVWRLVAHGTGIRYEPTVSVRHHPRDSWPAWWRQRVDYGSAAAELDARHPGAVAPLRLNRWSVVTWGAPMVLPFGWGSIIGSVAALGSTARLAQRLGGGVEGRAVAIRLAGRGNLFAVRSIASAITRVWWPVVAVVASFSPRWRRLAVAAAVIRVLDDGRSPSQDLEPWRRAALRLADDVAYGCGVWKGCVRRRRFGALRPDID